MRNYASELRYAIERGAFAGAREIWEQWARELELGMAAGTIDPAEWESAADLCRWSRNVLLAERAHLLHRLNKLHVASAYQKPSASPDGTLLRSRL
jgi:hypothetical protein